MHQPHCSCLQAARDDAKVGVLFVCLGNICRSPTAEAVFVDVVKKAGLSEQYTIDSCGTGGGSPDWYLPGGFSYHEGAQRWFLHLTLQTCSLGHVFFVFRRCNPPSPEQHNDNVRACALQVTMQIRA